MVQTNETKYSRTISSVAALFSRDNSPANRCHVPSVSLYFRPKNGKIWFWRKRLGRAAEQSLDVSDGLMRRLFVCTGRLCYWSEISLSEGSQPVFSQHFSCVCYSDWDTTGAQSSTHDLIIVPALALVTLHGKTEERQKHGSNSTLFSFSFFFLMCVSSHVLLSVAFSSHTATALWVQVSLHISKGSKRAKSDALFQVLLIWDKMLRLLCGLIKGVVVLCRVVYCQGQISTTIITQLQLLLFFRHFSFILAALSYPKTRQTWQTHQIWWKLSSYLARAKWLNSTPLKIKKGPLVWI